MSEWKKNNLRDMTGQKENNRSADSPMIWSGKGCVSCSLGGQLLGMVYGTHPECELSDKGMPKGGGYAIDQRGRC